MQYILYNELANNGKGKETAESLSNKLNSGSMLVNVCDISLNEWIDDVTKDDSLIICGGDGTLNRFVNDIDQKKVNCNVMIYPAGTGNDFLRDIKEFYDNSEMPSINKYIEKLPTVRIKDKEFKFINGIGFGIDGMCCEEADKLKAKGKKEINYAGLSVKLMLFKYKCPHATITIDDKVYEYKKAWLASAMNGRYYGGGMKAAPEQDRLSDTLTNVVFHDKGKIATLIAFPSIFKGEHVNKSVTTVLTGKKINVKFDSPMALQIDGETVLDVTEYTAWK